jgi:hypothetical protein
MLGLTEDVVSGLRVLDCRLGFVRWPERHETCSRVEARRFCSRDICELLSPKSGVL